MNSRPPACEAGALPVELQAHLSPPCPREDLNLYGHRWPRRSERRVSACSTTQAIVLQLVGLDSNQHRRALQTRALPLELPTTSAQRIERCSTLLNGQPHSQSARPTLIARAGSPLAEPAVATPGIEPGSAAFKARCPASWTRLQRTKQDSNPQHAVLEAAALAIRAFGPGLYMAPVGFEPTSFGL